MTSGDGQISGRAHRKERRLIPPFGNGSNPSRLSNLMGRALARCRFTPFTGGILSSCDSYVFQPEDSGRAIEPQFEIVLDEIDALTRTLELTEDELVIGLSARSSHLKRYEVLHQWELKSLPVVWSPATVDLMPLQTGRGLDFVLALRVVSNRRRPRGQGIGPGKVLCRREFSVREAVDTFTFPFRWAEFGGDSSYPAELLWTIDWHDSEDDSRYQRPLSEALTVVGNKRAEDALNAMNTVPGASGLAWRMVASDIIVQIFNDVLENADEEPDTDDSVTLTGQVFTRLANVSGKSYGELKGLVDQGDSLAELRGLVARLVHVVR